MDERKIKSFKELDEAHELLTLIRFKKDVNKNLQETINKDLEQMEKNTSEILEAAKTLREVYGIEFN